MKFIMLGFDVYSPEIDDKGIDFIIRKDEETYFDVQVKSIRGLNYIFFPKSKFEPRKNLLAAIVLFFEGKPPRVYLIPSIEWQKTNALLVSHDYIGKKSKAEWGLNLSKKNLPLLEKFEFEKTIQNICTTS